MTDPVADVDRLVDVTEDLRHPRPRLVVRHRRPDGSVADVVGLDVDSCRGRPGPVGRHGSPAVRVLPDDGPLVVVPADAIAATRVVPPRAVRPVSSPAAIERIAARGWPGVEQTRLGGWLLRAGGGWTGRANSALTVGDPGVPLEEALDAVRAFYRDRGLTARLHVPLELDGSDPSGLDPDLRGRGWRPVDETLVLVTDLRRLALPEDDGSDGGSDDGCSGGSATPGDVPPGLEVGWADEPDSAWFSLTRGGSAADDPAAAAVLRAVPARYLTLRRPRGDVAAVGRVVVTDDWCGIGGIEVAPSARRAGLGRVVTGLLLGRARAAGARFAYLQTLRANTAALALYDAAGFTPHHAYHYLAEGPDPDRPVTSPPVS
ncbi:GNAT family N-acetyltransferase [Agilicoccus flavus]|uniref:GNAT family N-acetyltransferase n=1 Tax=Agilicoccus flavus TaxID=2775968 RepID=UPI001CF6DF01|nr:GNAT family N-acetyltransferase [Agilicoccus flavus]